MEEVTSRKDDIEHMRGNLQRLFKLSLEAMDAVEAALGGSSGARDLTALAALAEHLKDTIYSEALFFIAKWQPLGRVLLHVESMIKVSYDLFRITRYANEIMMTLELAPNTRLGEASVEAARRAREMVERAFKAFTTGRAELARGLEELDSRVDELYRMSLRRIASRDNVSRNEALEALVLRQLERVADHATYIARETLRAIGETSITI